MSYNPANYYPPGYFPEGYFPEDAAVPGVTVPDVVGDSQATATSTLEGAGFVVDVQSTYSPTVPVGDVASQSPSGGVEAPAGSIVTIYVSLGPAGSAGGSKKRFGFGFGVN